MKRSNSTIELLRILLLFFLVATHWYKFGLPNNFLDTRIVQSLTVISVTSFGLITGIFVFSSKKLFFRNISRLLFIIVISALIGFTLFASIGSDIKSKLSDILSGSRDSGYLYAILGVYLFGPFLAKTIKKMKWFTPGIIGICLILLLEISKFMSQSSSLFYGTPYSFIYLFALALIGNTIGRMKLDRLSVNLMFMPILISSVILCILLNVFNVTFPGDHDGPFTIIISICVISLAFFNPFYSRKINGITKRLYFVYEYHGYWQYLWAFLFAGFIKDHPHLQLYVNGIVIFLFGSVMSILITQLQLNVGNKYVDPQMLKAIAWTKSKLIKPKVSN